MTSLFAEHGPGFAGETAGWVPGDPGFPTGRGAEPTTRGPRMLRHLADHRGEPVRVSRQVAVLLAVGALTLACASVAFAYWTSSGAGTGQAIVPESGVTATAGEVDGLYPGGPPVTAPVRVVNPQSRAFEVTGLLPQVSASPAACPGEAVRVASPSPLPTVSPSATATVHLGLTMPADAPDGCQGATFTIAMTVEGRLR